MAKNNTTMDTFSEPNILSRTRMEEHIVSRVQDNSISTATDVIKATTSPGRKPRVPKMEPPALNLVDVNSVLLAKPQPDEHLLMENPGGFVPFPFHQ